jgi:hypothetical protein
LTPDQAERISHRKKIITKLVKAIDKSSDPDFIQRANWIIEEKKFDIRRISAEGALTPNAETIAAFEEIEAGGGEIHHGTTEEIFERILDEDGDPPQSHAAGPFSHARSYGHFNINQRHIYGIMAQGGRSAS